jgi:hypothetical protein
MRDLVPPSPVRFREAVQEDDRRRIARAAILDIQFDARSEGDAFQGYSPGLFQR